MVEAACLVAEVLDRARALGSAPLADRAAALERRIGARRPTPDPWAPLTAREYEIARGVAAGRTNAEIATELGLSPKTVAAHVEHMNKLGASRRAEIAAWATAAATRDGAAAATRDGAVARTGLGQTGLATTGLPVDPPGLARAPADRGWPSAGARRGDCAQRGHRVPATARLPKPRSSPRLGRRTDPREVRA